MVTVIQVRTDTFAHLTAILSEVINQYAVGIKSNEMDIQDEYGSHYSFIITKDAKDERKGHNALALANHN